MAVTDPVNVDSSIPELWARLTLRDHLYSGFWGSMVGKEGSRSPIIQRTDLLNSPGDTIHIQVTSPLAGAGVSGDTATLEGNEEALATSDMKVIPILYRHAVKINRRAKKKSIVDLREEAKMRLAEWGGEKMDDLRFANFTSIADLNGETYLPNRLSIGGGTNVPGDIATTDTLTVAELQKIRLTMYNNRAKPLAHQGRPVFMGVVHPNALYNLKRESEYRDWVREAHVAGESNPFFVGATAMVDGIVLFEHVNVPTALDGASSNAVARNVFFGAEAFVEGVDENVSWNEDTFDYGLYQGTAYSFAFQARRALAKNSLLVYSAATAP
jgi:N4-gp56 family major capsid protein